MDKKMLNIYLHTYKKMEEIEQNMSDLRSKKNRCFFAIANVSFLPDLFLTMLILGLPGNLDILTCKRKNKIDLFYLEYKHTTKHTRTQTNTH